MRALIRYLLMALMVAGVGAWLVRGSGTAIAAGNSSFGVAPLSGSYMIGATVSVAISETSNAGDNMNAVQANLSFPAGMLSWQSTTLTGPFTLCGQNAHGAGTVNIGCAAPSAQNGTQAVATVSFTVIAAGSAPVTMVAGSDIDNMSGASIWNGVLPGATYTLTAPPGATPTPTPPPAATPAPASAGATPKPVAGGTKSTPTPTPGATSTPAGASPTPTAAPTPAGRAATNPSELGCVSLTISDASGRVVGAKVELGGITLTTNANGVVNFSGVTSGHLTVKITAAGDQPIASTITLAPGQNQLLSYHLTKAASTMPVLIWIFLGFVLAGGGGFWLWNLRHTTAAAVVVPQAPIASVPAPSSAAPNPTTYYPNAGSQPPAPAATPPNGPSQPPFV